MKHCHKKRRSITFTANAQEKKAQGRTLIRILWQPKEDKHSSKYIHHSTNPDTPEWTSLNHYTNLMRISHPKSMQQNATNFIMTSHNGKKAWNLKRKKGKLHSQPTTIAVHITSNIMHQTAINPTRKSRRVGQRRKDMKSHTETSMKSRKEISLGSKSTKTSLRNLI
jgi:hypothetical protein